MKIYAVTIITLFGITSLIDLRADTNSPVASFSADATVYNPQQSPADKTNADETLGISVLGTRPNLIIYVDKTQPCPPQDAFSLSNTNLFSSSEITLLRGLLARCRNSQTDIEEQIRLKPDKGYDMSYSKGGDYVRYRVNTNFQGQACERSAVATTNHSDWQMNFQQIEHGQLNGLRLELYGDKGGCLMHFTNDEAVGDWFDWSPSGNLRFKAKFEKPFAFFQNLVMFKPSGDRSR